MAKPQRRQQPSFNTVFAVILIVLLLLAVLVWIMVSPPGLLLGL